MTHWSPDNLIIHGDAEHLPLADGSVDLVFGSPPYAEKAARYGKGLKCPSPKKTKQWAKWMVRCTREALRVCRGPVGWVVNGAVRKGTYIPAAELLMLLLHDDGICVERPTIWQKNCLPNRTEGKNTSGWFSNSWEFIVWAKHPGKLPFFDWKAIGTPQKYQSGGGFCERGPDGHRRKTRRRPDFNALVKPRDIFSITVGGGHMGSKWAHASEAPFPEKLVEPFIKVFAPPGGIVLDPFGGSGTTAAVAQRLGRRFVSIDRRWCPCWLTQWRTAG